MTILVGTDFSKTSAPVAVAAAELARRRGEELIVAHVVDGPLLPASLGGRDQVRIAEEARRLSAHGCRVRPLLAHDGSRGKHLAELAEREHVSLLVVGAQGAGLRSPLGTVATAAIRHTTLPVLVVRHPERLWEQRSTGRLRALVSLSLDDADAGLLDALKLVASTGDLEADFVHYRPLPEPPAESKRPPIDEQALRPLGELPTGIVLRSVFERYGFGRLDAHISDLARERDADLVVCGSHHRHGVERLREGSVAEGIAVHAPVSVLVARAPASLNERLAASFAG